MRLAHIAEGLGRGLWSLLAPERCSACGAPSQSAFCSSCGVPSRAESPDERLSALPVVTVGVYAPPLSTAIRRWKFEGHPELARPLAELLAGGVAETLHPVDVWVPVPLHRERLVERGYNQSALLAAALARSCGGRSAARALERRKGTLQQARLGRRERGENVRDAFGVRGGVPRGRVVLVDDVITTGATVRACLEALTGAGAELVGVIALARAAPAKSPQHRSAPTVLGSAPGPDDDPPRSDPVVLDCPRRHGRDR